MNQQQYYPGSRQATPMSNGDYGARPNGRQSDQPPDSNQSRAARFEDEKKRIIEACFNKKDPDGMQLESYITHVRVLEDASYPSSPPPPDSASQNKKQRVILVAVRRSGKVRVHKARENPNGSFSIGKTWNLDELTAIISYSNLAPANPQQQMEKQWASNTGFTVSLGKPYFWAAPTPKEKDFFIASLVKIYRKYTGGRAPDLIGFAPGEVQQLTGSSAQGTPTMASKTAFSPIVPSANSPQPNSLQAASPIPPSIPPVHGAGGPQSPYIAQPIPSQETYRSGSQDQGRAQSRPRQSSQDGYRSGSQDQGRASFSRQDQRPPFPLNDGRRSGSQDQGRNFARQEQRPPVRDVPQPSSESERPMGLPPRPKPRQPVQDEAGPRAQPYNPYLARDETRTPSFPSNLQPAPLRPSVSPKGSQSSLQRQDPMPQSSPLKPNGLGLRQLGSQDFGGRRVLPSPSPDPPTDTGRSDMTSSSRPTTSTPDTRRSDRLSNSRPSTATSDHKQDSLPVIPTTIPSLPSLGFELFPDEKKPLTPARAELRPEPPPAPPSQGTNSTFVTPLGTPSARRSEEEPRKQDYFATPEKGTPEKKQSQANEPVQPKPVYAQVTMPEPEPIKPTPEVVPPEPADSTSRPATPRSEEEYRPGLGPMVKKKSGKDIANQFRKAALAASAFQPRQGGAGARLKAMQDKLSNEPDGVTSVVPAPLKRGMSGDSARSATPDILSPGIEKDMPTPKLPPKDIVPRVQIERTATSDSMGRPVTPVKKPIPVVPEEEKVEPIPESPDKNRSASPQRKYRQRLEAEVEKHCINLGIDPSIIDGDGADLNELMAEFDWDGKVEDDEPIDRLESDIRREIGRAQASGWLGHVEQEESKVHELATAFDKAIAECEELDGLLTLYAHELDTLHEDIEYIEAQGQGLQVQTANQKLLQASLQNLLKTLTISPSDLRTLQSSPLDSYDGVGATERALHTVYDAMLTIDPELGQNKLRRAASNANRLNLGKDPEARIDKMRAVREKKDQYNDASMIFVNRFNQHMKNMFALAEQRTSEENSNASISSGATSSTLNLRAYQTSRQDLWVYNAMMLFVREVNHYEWTVMIASYERNFASLYSEHFKEFEDSRKKNVRMPTIEDQEILFTHHEKENSPESNLTSAARKLTVRGRKPAKPSALKNTVGMDRRDGKSEACVIFDSVLQAQATAIFEEQNFIVHLFHLNSQSTEDFVDVIKSQSPEQRKVPNLQTKLSYDPDRNIAKIVQNTTEGIYAFWQTGLSSIMRWVVRLDEMQGIAVLVSLEQCLAKYEETNQEFITKTVRGVHDQLTTLFHKFVEEQIKAIEETKVKVKKRKGVISFMRTFPEFSTAVEDMIPQEFEHEEALEVRFIVNDAYNKILKAMWESLNFIAKDNPTASSANGTTATHSNVPSSNDPEDKEALNYHILHIENMTYFVDEVKTHNNVVLEEWLERASKDQRSHMTQYTDAVIRRPLGKWLDFLESTEALMKGNDASMDYKAIATKPSHSRSAAKKVINGVDSKELKKGIDVLKKRVEKHFTDLEDLTSDRAKSRRVIVEKVFEECAVRYSHAWDRMKIIIEKVYDNSVNIDWRKEDVTASFKR